MESQQPVVQLKELTFEIGGRKILDGIDLDVYSGEIFAVMGLSGTGKTTLLRLIAGLIKPTSGSISVLGNTVSEMSESEINKVRNHIGFVFQYGALFDSLTVQQNVGFRHYEDTNLPEKVIRNTVAEKLQLVGMSGSEELYPAELSGGMQKRIGIARALVSEPEILLYDEPTSGLDPIIAATIDELITRLRKDIGVTEILVSHDVTGVMRMADRIAFLYEGKVRMVGTIEDYKNSTDMIIRQFIEGKTTGPIQVT